MNEINIASNSSIQEYRAILQIFERLGASIIDKSDYEQLEYVTDQIYMDYSFEGADVTLHYEHYLGSFLISESLSKERLNEIKRKIQKIRKF